MSTRYVMDTYDDEYYSRRKSSAFRGGVRDEDSEEEEDRRRAHSDDGSYDDRRGSDYDRDRERDRDRDRDDDNDVRGNGRYDEEEEEDPDNYRMSNGRKWKGRDDNGDDDDEDIDYGRERKSKDKGKKKSSRDSKDKKSLERVRLKQTILKWGDESIKSTLLHFQCVSFDYTQNQKRMRMNMYFAHPNSDAHMEIYRSTFMVPYGNSMMQTPLAYMFQNRERYLDKVMESYVKANAHDKNNLSFSSSISNKNFMVCGLRVINVRSNIINPMSVLVDGVVDKYTAPHTVSWDENKQFLTVLTPNTDYDVVYSYDLKDSPNIQAIHGIHDIAADERNGISSWGDTTVRDIVSVDMCSGKFVWLMYNLPYLVKDYSLANKAKDEKSKLSRPEGITSEIYKSLMDFSEKHPMPNIYSRKARLDDNHIGKIIEIVSTNNNQTLMWKVREDQPSFRFPYKFIEYVIPKYRETTQLIRMANPENMIMTTRGEKLANDPDFGPNDRIVFTVLTNIFRPRLFAVTKPVKVHRVEEDDRE